MRSTCTTRFHVAVLSAIFLALLIAAGCGGGKSTTAANTTTQPSPNPAPSPAPPPAPNPSPTPAPSPSPTPAPNPSPTPTPPPGPTPTPSPSPTPVPAPGTQLGKVVLVVEENSSYSSVIGSSAMPYLNSLASQYGLATQYYADTHPSIGNYMMMTTGQIITNNDSFNGPVSVDNIVRHLLAAGKTWKAYEESLPSVGYTGGDALPYLHRHDPLSYFTDVVNSSVQQLNLVPFTQFATDLNANQLPDFSFVTPNMNNDAHNGPLSQADAWLQTNIAPLLNNADFQKNGLLIIVFDEAATSDSTHGGGRVAMVAVGPLVKKGQSTTLYQHENLLKTIALYLGIDPNIGAAGSAAAITDLVP